MKKVIAIILALCALCLAGCGKIMELKQEVEEMTALTEKFSSALASNDPEKVEECIHPNAQINEEKITQTIENFEQKNNVDFSKGVEVKNVGDFNIASNGDNGGNKYNVTCELLVGGVPVNVVLTIVNDDAGCGVYDFTIVE